MAGLGPKFKLKVQIRNSGSRSMSDLSLTFLHSHSVYAVTPSHVPMQVLLPGLVRELPVVL